MHPKKWSTLFTLTLIAMAILTACLVSDDLASPAIQLKPVSGGPDTRVSVTGEGFPAKAALSVRLGPPDVGATPQSYGEVVADTEGRFTLTFPMPGQWPDGTPITAQPLIVVVINEDGSVKATAPFRFQFATLSLDPARGVPGQPIQVSGQGFPGGASIALRLGVPDAGLDEENLAVVTVEDQGTFAVALTVPDVWPGSGIPVTEQELVIAAIDLEMEQTLAIAIFLSSQS